jgi:hypothetical protein
MDERGRCEYQRRQLRPRSSGCHLTLKVARLLAAKLSRRREAYRQGCMFHVACRETKGKLPRTVHHQTQTERKGKRPRDAGRRVDNAGGLLRVWLLSHAALQACPHPVHDRSGQLGKQELSCLIGNERISNGTGVQQPGAVHDSSARLNAKLQGTCQRSEDPMISVFRWRLFRRLPCSVAAGCGPQTGTAYFCGYVLCHLCPPLPFV